MIEPTTSGMGEGMFGRVANEMMVWLMKVGLKRILCQVPCWSCLARSNCCQTTVSRRYGPVVRRPLPFRGPRLRRTASRPPNTRRFSSNDHSDIENTLVVDVDRKLTERVLKVTVSCHRGLFQQSLFGTEARVDHDGDADVHEEMCTYVVLSGDTTMF